MIWLAIGLLSLLILAPCLAGVALVVPFMLAKEGAKERAVREALEAQKAAVEAAKRGSEKTPITAPTESTVPGQSLAPMDEPMPGMPARKPAADAPGAAGFPNLPPGVRWETKSGVDTFLDGKVQLDVRLLSEGLFVALRRRSLFNCNVASDEHLATSVGTTSLKLPPGEYDVLVAMSGLAGV